MGVKWTEEQEKVIRLRNRNILVSAAAGSGKTAVLVERIITMLTKDDPPMDVDRLLIVTFTEAAASEMKERIRLAIEKKLMEYPDNEHLKQQATLIHNAQITTIHSFCLSVIRDHFHAIDIDPGFRIGEEGELKLLRHDVLEDMLEEIVGEIRDEYDEDEEDSLTKINSNEYIVEGSMKLDDLNDQLGLNLESEDYDSIGGLVIGFLDHLPEEGETVEHEGFRFLVEKMDKNRIEKIHIYRLEQPEEEKEEP